MIVEFSVKNFRSIYDLQTISFVATNLKSSKDNVDVDTQNIYADGSQKLLKTVGIYGPNASGKSNIIKALEFFCEAVGDLPSPESRLSKLAQPFLYQQDAIDSESFFQIVVMIKGEKYRYGFTVKNNLDFNDEEDSSREIISNEWLFGPKKINQVKYFIRNGLRVDKKNITDGDSIATLEYEHTLFLTHAASYLKEGISARIRNVIKGFVATKFSQRNDFYRFHSIRYLEKENLKSQLIDFMNAFGLSYKDITFKNDEEFKRKNQYPLKNLFLTKKASHDDAMDITLNMQTHESEGTKKLFDLAGLVLHAFNIKTSGLIILDEIDSHFHPFLLKNLISLFNDKNVNKANAQLLFTSHDTNLMSPSIMRRDQFYLAEKQENESTKFYSLAELKGIRNDADFAKHYLAGFYGSLPVLSQFILEENIEYEGTLGT